MATNTLPALLSTLTEALKSAAESLPDPTALAPPSDGISLLDAKNELLLSYLQNLVFLIILKVQDGIGELGADLKHLEASGKQIDRKIQHEVVGKLVELRVYLERGVRPLEKRLGYQIDKIVRAAEDKDARNSVSRSNLNGATSAKKVANGKKYRNHSGQSDNSSDDSSDASEDEEVGDSRPMSQIDDLAYRPNPSALIAPSRPSKNNSSRLSANNIYQPPRITPTALPTTRPRSPPSFRRPLKSATIDEFVSTELSTAPVVQPSIGSTITGHGRRSKNAKEQKVDQERNRYEESNFVRLPSIGKKEKKRLADGRRSNEYGGEDWRGLGEGAERIVQATKRGSSSREGKGALEKSRKRERESDGLSGSGGRIGEQWEKRQKRAEKSKDFFSRSMMISDQTLSL